MIYSAIVINIIGNNSGETLLITVVSKLKWQKNIMTVYAGLVVTVVDIAGTTVMVEEKR